MSSFVKLADVRQEQFDWGVIGWRLTPDKGSKHLVIMDVTLEPGEGHDFHRHPGQEEMIIVKQGAITQYIEGAKCRGGDSVYLDASVSMRRSTTGAEQRACGSDRPPGGGEDRYRWRTCRGRALEVPSLTHASQGDPSPRTVAILASLPHESRNQGQARSTRGGGARASAVLVGGQGEELDELVAGCDLLEEGTRFVVPRAELGDFLVGDSGHLLLRHLVVVEPLPHLRA